ncbi:MAG: hypothetical protein EAZ43_13835 [Betaproteobacteria bacterium]|nr:MAG: hypothetical protein EAZ43_13835 [Betaproteobacteria bacterium]
MTLQGKRAFAYSADGGFGYAHSQPDELQAKRAALAYCEDPRPRGKALCQLVAVDTNFISSAEFTSNVKRGYNDRLSKLHEFYWLFTSKSFAAANMRLDQAELDAQSSGTPYDLNQLLSLAERLPLDKEPNVFDDWVKAETKHWGGYAARAVFNHRRAWKERGDLPASKTAPERFERVAKFVDLARSDAERALQLNPRCDKCYEILLNSTRLHKTDVNAGEWFERGKKVYPRSPELYCMMLEILQPKWGGSNKAMDALVQRASTELPARAAGKVASHREYLRGFWAVSEKDQITAYEQALSTFEHHSAAIRLAEIRRSQQRFDEVLNLMDRSLKNSPWDRYSLELKAIAHEKLNQPEAYFATIDKLLALKRRERVTE